MPVVVSDGGGVLFQAKTRRIAIKRLGKDFAARHIHITRVTARLSKSKALKVKGFFDGAGGFRSKNTKSKLNRRG